MASRCAAGTSVTCPVVRSMKPSFGRLFERLAVQPRGMRQRAVRFGDDDVLGEACVWGAEELPHAARIITTARPAPLMTAPII